MENKYDIVAIFCAILILLNYVILIIYLVRKRNNINVFDLIENNRLNSSFREEVNLILSPKIGEKVEILSSPWKGLCGYVTKYNEDSTYNIKVTRTLNPFYNHIPRNVIIKKDDEIILIE